jgi:hypothetical protein
MSQQGSKKGKATAAAPGDCNGWYYGKAEAAGGWWLNEDTPRSDPLLVKLPAWMKIAVGLESGREQ